MLWYINLYANGPWPWPKLMLSREIVSDLAKFEIAINGSDPGDKINKIGVVEFESGNIFCKSKGRGWINYSPMVFLIN